jgi:hypothetical protein
MNMNLLLTRLPELGKLTPKIRRLRVSEVTHNHPNDGGQTDFQKMPRLAIRLHFVVSRCSFGLLWFTQQLPYCSNPFFHYLTPFF